MKKFGTLSAILMLALASLACQTILGGGSGGSDPESLPPVDNNPGDFPTAPPESSDSPDVSPSGNSDFPMPDDAFNVVEIDNVVNYKTNLSLDEVMSFYRDNFGKQGLTEREILTTSTDGVFSFVFDGHESGQAIVIQGVDLGDGSVNVNISLQDT